MLRKLLYVKNINTFLRNVLKPFSSILPTQFKFPVNGMFALKGNHVPPFKMITNPTSFATKKLFWDNIEGFEFNSVKVFCKLVKHSKVFFDIGSNIGYYSLLASSITNKAMSVYAFEPMPDAFNLLKQNIDINGFTNIKAFQLALSNSTGEATFYLIPNKKFENFPQLTGDGGLNKNHSGKRTTINFDVKINTLDTITDENLNGAIIDLIKLDTEANEHFVLQGAKNVIRTHRPIIQCEILKNEIEVELANILIETNYIYYRATDNGLIIVPSILNNNTNFIDYYLVPNEKQIWFEKICL
jgi:FkbM family methyltransferase